MLNLGWTEVALILLAVLIIFGPKKIPEIGGAFGKTLRGFKEEINPRDSDDDEDKDIG